MKTLFQIFAIAIAAFTCCPTTRAQAIEDPEKIKRFIASRPELDIVTWADEARGAPFTVRFVSADEKEIIVEKTLNNGLTRRTLPFREITSISFSFTPTESAIHENPETAHIPLLETLWENRKPTLRLNNTETALTGLCLVKALRSEPTPEKLTQASAILSELLGKDLPLHLKNRASGETLITRFLTALLAENITLAEELAWKVTSESEYPDAMLIATRFLGERHFEELQALEEEHPRWELDDEIRPVRTRLYNLSLDFVIYPSLFHPTRKKASSEGLKSAAEVYRFAGSKELRLATLEDLAALYPDSEAAKETSEILQKLRANQPDPELAAEDPDEEIPDKSQPTSIPPKPKRYNLFTD